MEKIYLIGDTHTVNAFRVCGIEGFVLGDESLNTVFQRVIAMDDSSVIIITRECAEALADIIRKINFESARKVIIEIPGIDDKQESGKSLTGYITEALGFAL